MAFSSVGLRRIPTLLAGEYLPIAGPSTTTLRSFSSTSFSLAQTQEKKSAQPKKPRNSLAEAQKLIDKQAKLPKIDNFSPDRQAAPLMDVMVIPEFRELKPKTITGPNRLYHYTRLRLKRWYQNMRMIVPLRQANRLDAATYDLRIARMKGFRWLNGVRAFFDTFSLKGFSIALRRELEGIYVDYNKARAAGDLTALRRLSHQSALTQAEALIPRHTPGGSSPSEKWDWSIVKTNRPPKLINVRSFPLHQNATSEVCQVVLRFDTHQQLIIPSTPGKSSQPLIKTSHVVEYWAFDRAFAKLGSAVPQSSLGGMGRWRIRERVRAWEGGDLPEEIS